MIGFTKNKPENIYIVGDLKCQSYKLMMKIDMRNLSDSHLIIMGNFGIGTLDKSIEKKNLSLINVKLKKNNNKLYLLFGNLDNEKLFEKYKSKYKNIIFTEDYEIISIEGVKFMFLGGSDSYDRVYEFDHNRKKPIMFREFDVPKSSIDVVLTHESVDFVYPYNLYHLKTFSKTDKWIYNDIKKRKEKLSKVYGSLKKNKLKFWYSSKQGISMVERKNNTNFIQLKKMDMVKLDLNKK